MEQLQCVQLEHSDFIISNCAVIYNTTQHNTPWCKL